MQNVGIPASGSGETGHSRRNAHDLRNLDTPQTTANHNGSANAEKSLIGDDLEPSAADNLKSLVQECGVSPHKISELLQELPPSRSSDVLIDYYFSSMCVYAPRNDRRG